MAASQSSILQKIGEISLLAAHLPSAIQEATRLDKICTVPRTVQGATTWETLNRVLDILFGDDVRNEDGRLKNVRRGRLGLSAFCSYLQRTVQEGKGLQPFWLLLDIKIERLLVEMKTVWSVL